MRSIKPDQHPDNICVFTAESLMEALLKADTACREGYKAAIWFNPGQALDTSPSHLLTADFMKHQPPDLRIHFLRSAKLGRQYRRESYKMPAPGLDPAIERRRFSTLPHLRIAFEEVIPDGRCQMSADYAPHTDEEPHPEKPAQPENLFNGQHVKVLRAHNVAGTYVFDEKDKRRFDEMGSDAFAARVYPKWVMSIGDVAFFQGGFLHSTEKFKLTEGKTPRTIDIQDCSGGIPLTLARQIG